MTENTKTDINDTTAETTEPDDMAGNSNDAPQNALPGDEPPLEDLRLKGRALSVSLTVNDIVQSLSWYGEVLGFEVNQRYEREGKLFAVSLSSGEARILITQDNNARGTERVKGEGFSMMITTVQNIDSLAEAIRERGGTLDSEPADTPWGQRMFRLRDPDGFKFTIASERDEQKG